MQGRHYHFQFTDTEPKASPVDPMWVSSDESTWLVYNPIIPPTLILGVAGKVFCRSDKVHNQLTFGRKITLENQLKGCKSRAEAFLKIRHSAPRGLQGHLLGFRLA